MSLIIEKNNLGFDAIRNTAKTALAAIPFPGVKDEEWRYTRIGKLKNKQFALSEHSSSFAEEGSLFPHATVRLVFNNGIFDAGKSIGHSAYVKRIAELSETELQQKLALTGYIKEGIFTSYNDAFFTDGVLIELPEGANAKELIELVFVSSGSSTATVVKNILIAHAHSSAEVVFNFIASNANDNLVNHALHAIVHPEAKIELYKLQQEKTGVSHFSSENVFQQEKSNFAIHTLSLYGDLVRNDLNVKVDGEFCESHLGGVVVADKKMHIDNHTLVDHQKPNCNSNEQYKSIVKDESTSVFNGKIFVRRDAQKINAYQNSANVLMSDDANVYTKPELEIYADDVKCSHGTTTGCLDENALFYLQARGIGEDSARNLLVQAFAADVIEKIENEEVRNWFIELVDAKLQEK